MDSLGGIVTPNVDIHGMERTASLSVTVIMSTVVQSLRKVRYIIIYL